MTKPLRLGITDTHPHLATFFTSILSSRYDVVIDNTAPDFLLFGDDNFGNTNKKYSRNDCVKLFYTGENRRPAFVRKPNDRARLFKRPHYR